MVDREMEEISYHPKDRGWAWMVVLGCTISIFMMGGTLRTFGILMEEIIKYFDIPKSVAVLIMTVEGIGYTLTASVGVLLGERFGARTVVMIAGVIGGVGLTLGSLLINITFLICTIGIGFGFANGLIHGNGFVMVSRYFEKRRALATGLSMSGGSVGQFVMPFVLQFLLETYSLSGTLLIVGGIYLNVIVSGALYRPITFYNYRKKRSDIEDKVKTGDSGGKEETKPLTEGVENLKTTVLPKLELAPKFGSLQMLDSSPKHGSLQKLGPSKEYRSFEKLDSSHKCVSLHTLDSSQKRSPSADNLANYEDKSAVNRLLINKHIDHLKVPGKGGNPSTLSAYVSMEDIVSASMVSISHLDDDRVATTSIPDQKPSVCSRCCASLGRLKALFDFSLLKNLSFLYYTLTTTINFVGFFNVVFFIPSHAVSRNFSSYESAFLISINGIFDLVGRIGCGWFADLNLVQRYKILTVVMLTNGLNSVILPFASEYWWLAIHCGVYGATCGAFLPLLPVITVDLFGLDLLPRALAILLFTMGAAGGLEQPLLGLLGDVSGSLDIVFYVSGGISLVGTVLTVLLPLVVKPEKGGKPIEVSGDGQVKVASPGSEDATEDGLVT